MPIQIETPPMGGGNVRQQLEQMQSYLHRTAQQLQWAFETLETGAAAQAEPGQGLSPGNKRKPQAPSPEETFAGIRNLIIKSADIVESYSQTIKKKLDGEYVARSQFGDYREKTSLELSANASGIQQLYASTARISRDLSSLSAETAATRAYIRTGCLKEGAFPVYGLEIGQRSSLDGQEVFRKYARFTADRLSFYDAGDMEVAYISDYQLYITNARIAGTMKLGGRFQVSFDQGLTFQWTEGEK